MRKCVLMIAFISLCIGCSSQYYIGFSPAQVLDQAFKKGGVKIAKRYMNDGQLFITWDNYDIKTQMAVFFQDSISIKTWIIPVDSESLEWWSIVFTKTYIKASQDSWKAYTPTGTFLISLTYSDKFKKKIFTIYEIME